MLLYALLNIFLATQQDNPAHWLEGCWVDKTETSFEIWSPIVDGHLFGYGYSLDGQGQMRSFEHLRIEKDRQGRLRYIAYPAGRNATVFEGQQENPKTFTVTNPHHDFPQIIRYTFEKGRLSARISKLDGSNAVLFEKRRCNGR